MVLTREALVTTLHVMPRVISLALVAYLFAFESPLSDESESERAKIGDPIQEFRPDRLDLRDDRSVDLERSVDARKSFRPTEAQKRELLELLEQVRELAEWGDRLGAERAATRTAAEEGEPMCLPDNAMARSSRMVDDG